MTQDANLSELQQVSRDLTMPAWRRGYRVDPVPVNSPVNELIPGIDVRAGRWLLHPDLLLNYASLLELGTRVGFVPEKLPEPQVEAVTNYLQHPEVVQYWKRFEDRNRLPHDLLDRFRGEPTVPYGTGRTAMSLFQAALGLNLDVADGASIARFFEISYEAGPRENFLASLSSPERFLDTWGELPQSEVISEEFLALTGMQEYFAFVLALDDLLSRAHDEPHVGAAIWQMHAARLPTDSQSHDFVNTILDAFERWSERDDAEATGESLESIAATRQALGRVLAYESVLKERISVHEIALPRIQLLRNIAILAAFDAGKTTTTERVLYYTGRTHKIGEVHEGAATMDWMEQERELGITITSAATTCHWDRFGQTYHINIIDTPGHPDFTAEVERSLRVLDGALCVFDAAAGADPQNETLWHQADKYGVPRICFVNKMDRGGANFERCVDMIRKRFGANPVPIQLPIGDGEQFVGIIDVIRQVELIYDESTLGKNWTEQPVRAELQGVLEAARLALVESALEHDEYLTERYLESEEISEADLRRALRNATIAGVMTPVLTGSAFKNKGVQQLLDAVVDYLPAPVDIPAIGGTDPEHNNAPVERHATDDEPFSALAFKIAIDPFVGKLTFFRVYSGVVTSSSDVLNSTKGKRERVGRIVQIHANKREEIPEARAGDIAAAIGLKETTTGNTLCDPNHPVVLESMTFPDPVIQVAVEPRAKVDQDKMSAALHRLADEDPTFRFYTDPETEQTIIAGMGELHLEIIVDRMLREFGVDADVGHPQVAYRETIRKTVERVEGKFVRHTGGSGQYGHVVINMSPAEPGQGFVFEDKVVGGVIPREFIKPAEQGMREAMEIGVLAGYPMVDVKVQLVFGSYHDVDSSALAFKIAGSMAFKEAARRAGPVLLEPMMSVEVVTPADYMGDVIGDLSSRRGKIQGIDQRGGAQVINAVVPLSEMFGYSTSLRSMSQGRAVYSMQFAHYEEVPKSKAEEITAKLRG